MSKVELTKNLEQFAIDVITPTFDGADLTGGEIQDIAVNNNILIREIYDPSIHTNVSGDLLETGDEILILNLERGV